MRVAKLPPKEVFNSAQNGTVAGNANGNYYKQHILQLTKMIAL